MSGVVSSVIILTHPKLPEVSKDRRKFRRKLGQLAASSIWERGSNIAVKITVH